MSKWMLRNSRGRPDGLFSLSVIAVVVVLVKFFVAGLSLTVASHTISAAPLDGMAGAIGAILGPLIGGYCHRRWTDRNTENGPPDGPPDVPPENAPEEQGGYQP